MNRIRQTLFAVATLTLFGLTANVKADSAMFILDVSGSMWGQIEPNVTKIEAARQVMGNLLKEIPDEVATGLVAYGHRKKGDCKDIEVVQPLQKSAGSRIAGQLSRLIPRGRTPISDSLLAGAKLLKAEEGNKTLVLVSDGIETCAGDPCAVAGQLAATSTDLQIHVVGYAVNTKTQTQLQCIADKGHGRYFTADDVSGLQEAFSAVTTAIAKSEPLPEPPKKESPKVEAPQVEATTKSTRIRIKVAAVGTVRVEPPQWVRFPPKYWKLTDPETGEEITKTRAKSIKVKPGEYQIVWRHREHGANEVELSQIVSVKGGETTVFKPETGMRLTPPSGMKRPYYWQLLADEKEAGKWYRDRATAGSFGLWDPVPVPRGRYRLILRQSEHGHSEVDLGWVEAKPNQLTDVVLDQGLNLQWPESWKRRSIYYLKATDENGKIMKFRDRGPIILSPGKYKLAFRLVEHGWTETDWGEITVPEKGFVDGHFTSGITFLSKERARHSIYAVNLDTNKESMIRNHWGPMPLPPGRYKIDYQPERSKRYNIVEEIQIKPNEMIEAEM